MMCVAFVFNVFFNVFLWLAAATCDHTSTRPQFVSELETYQEVISSRRDAVSALMATTETAAAQYQSLLLSQQECLTKLPKLDKAETWFDEQLAVFAAGEYGSDQTETSRLMESLRVFELQLAAYREVCCRLLVAIKHVFLSLCFDAVCFVCFSARVCGVFVFPLLSPRAWCHGCPVAVWRYLLC